MPVPHLYRLNSAISNTFSVSHWMGNTWQRPKAKTLFLQKCLQKVLNPFENAKILILILNSRFVSKTKQTSYHLHLKWLFNMDLVMPLCNM